MRIYITGSNGFVAQKFCEIATNKMSDCTVYGVSKSPNRNIFLSNFEQLDLTDFDNLQKSLDDFRPTHILHTAAMTTVEGCEINKEQAFLINIKLTDYLAAYSKENDVHLTFLSTDFVFDGTAGPYSEATAVNPLNYYGLTKSMAEECIKSRNCRAAILRTILIYGVIPDTSRSNVVLWAKNQLELGNTIRVVSDQWRMPTWVDDLANVCVKTLKKESQGIYHISSEKMMSIEELVRILANVLSFNNNLIIPISAKDIGQDKNRPRLTGFDLTKAKNEFDFEPTSFVDSLLYICEQLKIYGR